MTKIHWHTHGAWPPYPFRCVRAKWMAPKCMLRAADLSGVKERSFYQRETTQIMRFACNSQVQSVQSVLVWSLYKWCGPLMRRRRYNYDVMLELRKRKEMSCVGLHHRGPIGNHLPMVATRWRKATVTSFNTRRQLFFSFFFCSCYFILQLTNN